MCRGAFPASGFSTRAGVGALRSPHAANHFGDDIMSATTPRAMRVYPRVVQRDGNRVAQNLVNEVFEVCDRKWRGVGSIPKSGYKLRWEFRAHDADRIFDTKEIDTKEPDICISGLVLKGVKKPHDCPAFGKQCTPENPLGATMVSAEGACAAYYAYGRHLEKHEEAVAL